MLRTRTFWAVLLAVLTSVLIFETKVNLPDSALWTQTATILSAPGTHLVTALDSPNSVWASWVRFWQAAALGCNFLIYAFFWYACLWMVGYFRARRSPYDRPTTLLSH